MIELITGHAGTNHISAEDVRAANRGTFGSGNYILEGSASEKITAAMAVKVPALELMLNGSHFRTDGTDSLKFTATTQGQTRVDYICARYLNSGGVESAELVIVAKGQLSNTFEQKDYPLYECTVSGSTMKSITCMLTKLQSIATSTQPKVTTIKNGGTGAETAAEARKNLGLSGLFYTETVEYDGEQTVQAEKTCSFSLPLLVKAGYKPVGVVGYKIKEPVILIGNDALITINNISVGKNGVTVQVYNSSKLPNVFRFECDVLFMKEV